MPNIRVLPILIFVCCFTLFLRIENIWAESKEVAKEAGAASKTEDKKPGEAKAEDSKPADTKADGKAEAKPDAKGDKPAEAGKTEPKLDTAIGAEPSKQSSDPILFNDSELDILQSLAARRTQLDERERQIEQKEGLLQITEQRIDQKLSELKQLKGELESTRAEIDKITGAMDKKEQDNLNSLVKTYETMKPKDAAARFDNLDLPLQVKIARNLKEAKLAPIMASMDAMKAAKLTTELAKTVSTPPALPAPAGGVPPAPPEKPATKDPKTKP